MEAIKALKSAFAPMNFRSFKHLSLGEYVVKNFKFVKTSYGQRVRIEIDNFFMYLPERVVDKLDNKLIDVLNSNPVMMTYLGKDPEVQNRLLLDFEMLQVDKNGELVKSSVLNGKDNTVGVTNNDADTDDPTTEATYYTT